MSTQWGTGRQALIEATADVLRTGGEIQVKEVAAAAGVSHTLIYRHFPDGGKDELIAEAYAHLFKGLAEADIDSLFAVLQSAGPDPEAIGRFIVTVLNPRRSAVRWARLEALAQSRSNPFVAERVEAVRVELVRDFAERLRVLEPGLTQNSATALSIFSQALPFGVTAMGGQSMSKALREEIASMWAEALVHLLTRAKASSSPSSR